LNFVSLADIFNNLHGKVSKTNVPKILANLANSGEINSKTYGKQIVYVAKQVD